MSNPKNLILSESRIRHIVKRIAFEIVENNYDSGEVVLVGIQGQGLKLAEHLKKQIRSIDSSFKCEVMELMIEKSNPRIAQISINKDLETVKGRSIVLVDDVMNSGRTQAHALSYILQTSVKKFETAVLVNRSHKRYPISATYSGIELSTTIDEHIEVVLEGETAVYLY